jgi:hypothetical protein
MKNINFYKQALRTAALLTAVAAMTACSDDDASSNLNAAVTPSAIAFNLSDDIQQYIYTDATGAQCLPMVKGQSLKLDYTLSPSDATYKDVEWSSSNTSIATVDGEGTVAAVSGDAYSLVSVAPVGVYAGSGISATLKVVVSNELVPATAVTINSSADEVYAGDTLHLSATIAPDNSTYKTVKWSSSDESVASVSSDGILTAHDASAILTPVTITATTLDNSGVVGTKTINVRKIVQPQSITLDQSYSSEKGYLFALNEQSLDLKYTTTPAECTTSLIEWSSSDESIATVDAGKVTFHGFGSVTITATCPETQQKSSITLTAPAGLLRETYHNENHFIFYDANQSGNGTKTSHEWHDGYVTITTYAQNATTQRADIKCQSLPIYINAGSYPIFAIKMDDVKDKGATSRNINLDTKFVDDANKEYKGLLGGNNKYTHDYKCSDGSHVFIYDYSSTSAPKDATLKATLFQMKYADMKGLNHQIQYNIYWVQTFKSLSDVQKYITDTDKLTFSVVK